MKYNIFYDKQDWGTNIHFVAEDGLSFGAIELLNEEPKTAYIYGIQVHDTIQRRGRGSNLIKIIEKYIKYYTNRKKIVLNCNYDIIEFYIKLGYLYLKDDNDMCVLYKIIK